MNTDNAVRFIRTIKNDLARIRALNELLDEQYELLSARKSTELKLSNDQALEIMNKLKVSQASRVELLEALNAPTFSDKLNLFVQMLPSGVRKSTEVILEEVNLCSRLCLAKNERNGKLLAMQKELVHKIMGIPGADVYPEASLT